MNIPKNFTNLKIKELHGKGSTRKPCLFLLPLYLLSSLTIYIMERIYMLNKKQILKRVNALLGYKDVANKKWYIEQLEGLLVSAVSPEKFN